jgi:hypothetical protein
MKKLTLTILAAMGMLLLMTANSNAGFHIYVGGPAYYYGPGPDYGHRYYNGYNHYYYYRNTRYYRH